MGACSGEMGGWDGMVLPEQSGLRFWGAWGRVFQIRWFQRPSRCRPGLRSLRSVSITPLDLFSLTAFVGFAPFSSCVSLGLS